LPGLPRIEPHTSSPAIEAHVKQCEAYIFQWLVGAVSVRVVLRHSSCTAQYCLVIIIIMLPNQAIASTPSAPRPSGAEGSTAWCGIRCTAGHTVCLHGWVHEVA
jgi:hypothetical protein